MKYYIITGEPSGDMHAANLVHQIKKLDNNAIIRAFGGERLMSEGVSIAKDIRAIAFMGFWNVLKNLVLIRSNLKFCKEDILIFNPDALILVDYPGFNLRIAEYAKRNRIPVFYYISPKVWAWNKRRVSRIKKFVDHLLVIFPFEVEFYKNHNLDVNYVGNPLLDEINKKDYKFTYKYSKPIIGLFPGSRKQEIDSIFPEMLKVVDNYPNYQFVVACSNILSKEYYQSFIKNKNVILVFNETYGLLENAKVALVTSGTATLEAALFKVPQVVCYKTNWLTYFTAKFLLKINSISLVNIILKKDVVKELIQGDLNKKNLIKELDIILDTKKDLIKDYETLINILNKKEASSNAAKFIISSF